jgi:hypothetical protein
MRWPRRETPLSACNQHSSKNPSLFKLNEDGKLPPHKAIREESCHAGLNSCNARERARRQRRDLAFLARLATSLQRLPSRKDTSATVAKNIPDLRIVRHPDFHCLLVDGNRSRDSFSPAARAFL